MELNLSEWVEAGDSSEREFREAVHVVILAIKLSDILREKMVMKGGMLMAIMYGSPRYTKDIDFSTGLKKPDVRSSEIREELTKKLQLAGAMLNYATDCKFQSIKDSPKNKPEATFPSYVISIGYAERQTAKHRRLLKGSSPSVVTIDFSLNEPTYNVEKLEGHVEGLYTYTKVDIIAEKIRSLLQQEIRNRSRRQDVYDIAYLVKNGVSDIEKNQVHESLVLKCKTRNIEVNKESLLNPRVKQMAEKEYASLGDEIAGELPEFDQLFSEVVGFYNSLKWD